MIIPKQQSYPRTEYIISLSLNRGSTPFSGALEQSTPFVQQSLLTAPSRLTILCSIFEDSIDIASRLTILCSIFEDSIDIAKA